MAAIGPETVKYLRKCGYRDEQIAAFTSETRLLQDMRLHGDNADDELRLLEREFQIDLSTFPFRKYFPGEFERGWDGFVIGVLRWTKWAQQVRERYPPITLDMIERTIVHRKWIFD